MVALHHLEKGVLGNTVVPQVPLHSLAFSPGFLGILLQLVRTLVFPLQVAGTLMGSLVGLAGDLRSLEIQSHRENMAGLGGMALLA